MMPMATTLKNRVYTLTLFFLALTGFAQMPIFKRYYLADIPGLGWLAEFYVTHSLHYLFAALFVSLIFYRASVSLVIKSHGMPLGRLKWLNWISIAGLIITGGFMVFKNFEGAYLHPDVIVALDIGHLVFCMLLLCVLFMGKVAGRKFSGN
jgi:hypothetical protein